MPIKAVNPDFRARNLDKKMDIHDLHPVDVKAAIKKRFGSVAAFERLKKLPENGVHDVLRGRTSERVSKAVESVLMDQTDTPAKRTAQPQKSVNQKRHAA
jgi:lambda repressor-like predicted transcriptional regulator